MYNEVISNITRIMEIGGVLVIVIGAVASPFFYILDVVKRRDKCYEQLRKRFGRSILLGLEFLVAADIINTVAVKPTLDNVLVLGLIVLIRTFLSFSIDFEIGKRLPWQNK
jgi:uncharacterized membrane protein